MAAGIIAVIGLLIIALGIGDSRAPDLPAWRYGLNASGIETRMVLAPPQALYYDLSGRLRQVDVDTNSDRRPDVFRIFDERQRPTRAFIDLDFDGRIDRWEEYDDAGRTIRYSTSAHGAKPDRFVVLDATSGRLASVEFDEDHDGRRERREEYGPRGLSRVTRDSDGDGRMDRAEVWSEGRIVAEEIDRNGDGRMDLRLVRLPDGSLRVEPMK